MKSIISLLFSNDGVQEIEIAARGTKDYESGQVTRKLNNAVINL